MMIIAATFSAYLSPSNRNSWLLHAAKCAVYAESTSPFRLLFPRRVRCFGSFYAASSSTFMASFGQLQNFIAQIVIYGRIEESFRLFQESQFSSPS
jgi:hypothetical protein